MSSANPGAYVPSNDPTPNIDITGEILEYWWKRRWYITKVMLLAIIVFIGVLLLIPNRYRAQSTVIVLPPRFMPEVRAQPLTVSTVRTLLGSGHLLQRVIENLRTARGLLVRHFGTAEPTEEPLREFAAADENRIQQLLAIKDADLGTYLAGLSIGEIKALLAMKPDDLAEMSVDDLAQQLESEEAVEKRTASDMVFSPLVQLFAEGKTGPRAQLLANTWAFFFTRMYEGLTRVKTTEQFESIRNQQEISQRDLEEIQNAIVQYKAANNLELLQREIDQTSQEFQQYTQQLITRRTALEKLRGRLQQLLSVLGAMEDGGNWIGRVTMNTSDLASTGTGESATGSSVPDLDRSEIMMGKGDWSEHIRRETLQNRERLTSAMLEFTTFYREQPLELLEKERDQLQKDYLEAQEKLRAGTIRLEVLRSALVTLDRRLSGTAQLLTLATSVPEQTIGEAVAANRPQQLQNLSDVQFQRQELNPSWIQLQTQRNETQQELELARSETAELEQRLPEMEEQLYQLQNLIYQARLTESLVKEDLQRWQQSNEQLFRNYVQFSEDLLNAAQEIALLEREVQDIEQATSASQARAALLQRTYDQAAAELQILELRQRAIQRNADLLLQKVQEAQIAVRESVSDVSIAARAVAPERHYFPMRSLTLLLATIATGLALLAGLARQKYLQLRRGIAG